MAYLGRYQLGQTVPLRMACEDSDGAAAAPSDAPIAKVFGASFVLAKQMPVEDLGASTGLFSYQLRLDSNFSVGQYSVTYFYKNSSFLGCEHDYFEVIAGGNDDGGVIAMQSFELAHAKFVVGKAEDGIIFSGRNPRV